MYLDGQLNFSTAQAITATAASTNVIDLAGLGSGTALTNIIGNATAATWGMDIGLGDTMGQPKILCTVVVGATGGTSLNVQFQGAADNGSGSPSATWTTYAESGVIVEASLTTPGAQIWKIDVPEVIPDIPGVAMVLPRFLRLNYVAVGPLVALTVNADIIRDRQDWIAGRYASNFVVA